MSGNDLGARSWLAVLALGAFGMFGVGCTPSPEETCHRLDDLGRKDPGGFSLSMKKCMARMNEMRERDPDAYKCTARTVAKRRSPTNSSRSRPAGCIESALSPGFRNTLNSNKA